MFKPSFIVLVLLIAAMPVMAQSEFCLLLEANIPPLVYEICGDLDVGEACYGYTQVDVTAIEGATVELNAMGDRAALEDIATLTLSSMSGEESTWGIVLLRGETYQAALFGGLIYDVENGTLTALPAADCDEAPSRMIVQADEETTLTINGVEITFTGTVALLPTEDNTLEVFVVTGSAEVTASDETVPLEEGSESIVPLDDDLAADGAPGEVTESDEDLSGLLGALGPVINLGGGEDLPEITADGGVTPSSGTWEVERTSAYEYSACEGEMSPPEDRVDVVPSDPLVTDFDFSGGISIEIFVGQQMGSVPEAEFITLAPNVFRAIDHQVDPPIEFTLYVVSETEIVTSTLHWVHFPGEICGVIAYDYWMLQEG